MLEVSSLAATAWAAYKKAGRLPFTILPASALPPFLDCLRTMRTAVSPARRQAPRAAGSTAHSALPSARLLLPASPVCAQVLLLALASALLLSLGGADATVSAGRPPPLLLACCKPSCSVPGPQTQAWAALQRAAF